jgi:hypothetical protein
MLKIILEASLFLYSRKAKKKSSRAKTYNSGDSLVVTHLTTNPPVSCLNRAERTGSLVLKILWSYVENDIKFDNILTLIWS